MAVAPTGRAFLVAWATVAGAVLARPGVWPAALRAAYRLAPPGWWRRPPHLPLPPAEYLAFRMVTAYGDPRAVPPAADVVAYLRWVAAQPRPARRWRGRRE